MPFLALTDNGLAEATDGSRITSAAIWCGSDLLTQEQHAELLKRGFDVTRFSYDLSNAAVDQIAKAVDTMTEHHPGETVWVESAAIQWCQTKE